MIEKEAAATNENEAQEFQKAFLAQSEVQNSRVGNFAVNPGSDMIATQSYQNIAQFNKPNMPEVKQNPFEMPAGYPVEDGYKKSIVAKQNLPLNEPHPGKISLCVMIISRVHITNRTVWYGVHALNNNCLD